MYQIEILSFLCIFIRICKSEEILNSDLLQRERRQLLFPNSTLLQFNAGVGTPTPISTINVNWAFQANFQLPWNRSQIPIDILEANNGYVGLSRKKREASHLQGDYENDAKLYHFYQFIEEALNGFGHNGSACVLRALCQLGSEPLHTEEDDDLLHELATFVLNPENDAKDIKVKESVPYIEAYRAGQNELDCSSLYSKCGFSLLDIFSVIN